MEYVSLEHALREIQRDPNANAHLYNYAGPIQRIFENENLTPRQKAQELAGLIRRNIVRS